MFVNVAGLGQVNRLRPGARVLRIPVTMRRRGMGQALLAQPGPGAVGTQIVDANGNIVYSAAQVAANPSLLNQLNNGACTPPMVPTYFPGGQSECSMPGTVTSQIYGAPIDVCDDPSGLCQGSTFNGQTISQPNQLPSTGLPSGYLSNGTPAAGSQGVTASLVNTSRPGQSLQVGDSWTLTVTGPPNSPVSDLAVQNGNSLGVTPYGSTNSSGVFTLNGTATAGTVGTWSETWSVGGVNAPALNFSVAAAPSGSPISTAAAGGSNSSVSPQPATTTPAGSTATPAGCFAPLAALGIPDPCLGGFPIGMGTLAAGVLAFFIIGSMMGGKR